MRRTLGKGLSQLIAEQYESAPTELPTDAIVPNSRQPRTHFDDVSLEELAASIRLYGMIQPLIVRPISEGRYELIAGERRLRASKLVGLKAVPVVIRAAGNQNSLEIALIENLQRDDMNALECARAYRQLIEEFGLTQEQVAERVGKSRTSIANTIRLIRLPNRVQAALESGQISEGHARALLAFDSESKLLAALDAIVEGSLSVREVEQMAHTRRSLSPKEPPPVVPPDPHLIALENALAQRFSAPAKIRRSSGSDGGKIAIEFFDDEDLQRILETLGLSL